MCSVFAPGIDPKTGDTLDPGDPVPGNTSSKSPLICSILGVEASIWLLTIYSIGGCQV
jgi:hypothetical protein